ncbi:MAG TPA: hypothetical protein VK466_04790 [Terriglobales bacterium]|nr:hypothetical protein [Terriglobales bacterium]
MDLSLLNSRHWMLEVAVVATLCVLSMFFVPAAHGPYSSVHGPTTALRSWRTRLQLALSMWLAALGFSGVRLLSGSASTSRLDTLDARSCSAPPELTAVLRC